jgi:guanylate kinase
MTAATEAKKTTRPVVLAAPSGTGKTTIAHRLVEGTGEFVFSVSATTRQPRKGERNGMDYWFMGRPEFEGMIARGEFVEWAEVHGNFYGTPKRNFDDASDRGEHLVLDIDVQGARQIRERVSDALLVFVIPPSAEVLVSRLTKRGTERDEEVARRLRGARKELARVKEFDHVVVNDDLERAVEEVRAVARAARTQVEGDIQSRIDTLLVEIDRVLQRRYENVGA